VAPLLGRATTSSAKTTTTSSAIDGSGNNTPPYFPIYYNDVYEVRLPPKHRFPMGKYRKVRLMVQEYVNNLPAPDRSRVRCEFRVSPQSSTSDLELTHDRRYVQRFVEGNMTPGEERNVGFPWSPAGVRRARSSTGGTVAAACSAVEEWISLLEAESDDPGTAVVAPWAAHIAGGTHHAFYDRGEGFSVFSDIAVAANVVLQRYPQRVQKILIVDLDVHQGNGNAALFRGRPEVFTFSMQCVANYFSPKQESDLDIELPVGTTDETYLSTLYHWLKRIKQFECDLVFFQAGVDVLEEDRLGRLSLTQAGVERRNEMVFDFAREINRPLVITMGGGTTCLLFAAHFLVLV